MILTVEPFRKKEDNLVNGNYNAWLGGFEILVDARTPYYSAARWLLKFGCNPETVLELRHKGSEMTCLRGTVGEMAKWSVREDRGHGPDLVRFEEFPALPGARKP